MAALTKKESASTLADLFDWFDAGWPAVTEWRQHMAPTIRIEDRLEKDRYVLRAELPGMDPEKDIEITVTDGVLAISAERREEISEKGRSEFHYGSFVRRVTLPKGAQEDAVDAKYTDGILEITVPLTATGPEPRSIPVARTPKK